MDGPILSAIISIISVCGTLGIFEGVKVLIKHKTSKKIEEKERIEALARKQIEEEKRNQLITEINTAISTSFEPVKHSINDINKDIQIIKVGMQASLRNNLYDIYYRCERQGFAKQTDREDFENIYQQYHKLGANGVMDDIRDKFLDLPTSKGSKKK